MKAMVVHIAKPEDYCNPNIAVRVRGRDYTLATYRHPELYDALHVGQIIQVRRRANSPFLYFCSDK